MAGRKEEFVKICPNCGSQDLTIPPKGLDIRMCFPDYCKKCGYRGTGVIIHKKDLRKFLKLKK